LHTVPRPAAESLEQLQTAIPTIGFCDKRSYEADTPFCDIPRSCYVDSSLDHRTNTALKPVDAVAAQIVMHDACAPRALPGASIIGHAVVATQETTSASIFLCAVLESE
jgi:hypothetical protein